MVYVQRAGLTAGENLIGFVADWARRYGCPCPTSALCQDLGVRPTVLALLVDRLVADGTLRWVSAHGPYGDRDVTLAVLP